jgi:predicted N-formylglutamate amidohydrolase
MVNVRQPLFAPGEPEVTSTQRPAGRSPFVLACDHAGNRIPQRLGTLGLEPHHLERHIAYDIGALGVAERLGELLDAPLVAQHYSRLVIDSNRQPQAHDSVPTVSEDTEIPGNAHVPPFARRARIDEIFTPYHDGLRRLLDAREAAGRASVLVTVHSFTPVFKGVARPWHIGVLYNRDPRLGHILHELLQNEDLCVGDNEPYYVSDATDYTIPTHGEARGIPHVEIEIRQDQITEARGQALWAGRLARWLTRALERLPLATAAR